MMTNNKIEKHMTAYPTLAEETITVTEALEVMERHKVRHLPVVKGRKVIGIVSDRDLKQVELYASDMNLLVCDVMNKNPYCVTLGTSLGEVARQMAEHKYGSTVVLDHSDRVIGIFTTTDGMKLLSKLLSSRENETLHDVGIDQMIDIIL